jgi:molecular chaperone GrpE
VSNSSPTYLISLELRDLLVQKLGNLQRENVALQRSLQEQQTKTTAQTQDLFLELLEVADVLEALLDYLENNPRPSREFIARLPKSISVVNRKFLSVLGKRQLLPIELQEGVEADFNLCRVIDREERIDIPDQTITKIVRRGFYWGQKVLRPTEVITAQRPIKFIISKEPTEVITAQSEPPPIPLPELFSEGITACQEGRYPKAIKYLEDYCQGCKERNSPNYVQAQMWLIKAYRMSGHLPRAIAILRLLTNHFHPQVNTWANNILTMLSQEISPV